MSLLRASGHPQAFHYPLWLLFDEADRVRRRENRAFATNALLMQMVVSTVFGGTKAHNSFKEEIARLSK